MRGGDYFFWGTNNVLQAFSSSGRQGIAIAMVRPLIFLKCCSFNFFINQFGPRAGAGAVRGTAPGTTFYAMLSNVSLAEKIKFLLT